MVDQGEDPRPRRNAGRGDDSAMGGALVKVLGVALVLGLAISIGTLLLVKALGVSGEDTSTSQQTERRTTSGTLPTTALPVPTRAPTTDPNLPFDPEADGSQAPSGGILLSASPEQVGPGERIDLTGSYGGQDGVRLRVQRQEGSGWSDFPVDATVRGGGFTTYIQTGRTGQQTFRVYDAGADTSSNPVTVTVG